MLEKLLTRPTLTTATLQRVLVAVETDFPALAAHRCGSHVSETLLKVAGRLVCLHRDDDRAEEIERAFLSLCVALSDRLGEFLVHPYASHTLSAAVQVLGGVSVDDRTSRSRGSVEFRRAKMAGGDSGGRKGEGRIAMVGVPEAFYRQLEAIGRRVGKLGELSELLCHTSACPVVQVLARVLTKRAPSRGAKLIRQILHLPGILVVGDDEKLPFMFTDVVGSHLMGTLIELAPQQSRGKIYDTCFRSRVSKFALHSVANYPLQRLILVANEEEFAGIVSELSSLEDVLFVGHMGVVVHLLQAAVASAVSEQQSALLWSVLRAFHCEAAPKICAPLLLRVVAYEVLYGNDCQEKREGKEEEEEEEEEEEKKEEERKKVSLAAHCRLHVHVSSMHCSLSLSLSLPPSLPPPPPSSLSLSQPSFSQFPFSLHGSLIVQALLNFLDPKVIVRSLLHMPTSETIRVACDANGCHVIEAFMASRSVLAKRKVSLVNKLKVCMHNNTTTKNCRFLEKETWRKLCK